MKRTGFKRPELQRASRQLYRITRPYSAQEASQMVAPVPKAAPIRSEEYRRLVAALPCIRCGIEGYSQAAHADDGKGLAIKADDRTCYPACGPRPGIPGCHWVMGTSGLFGREEKRALEAEYGTRTRFRIASEGNWPQNLPMPDWA